MLSTYDSRRRGEVVRPTPRKRMENPSVPVPPIKNPAEGIASAPKALNDFKKTSESMESFANMLDGDQVASRELKRVESMAARIMQQEPDPKKASALVKEELMRWRTQGARGE